VELGTEIESIFSREQKTRAPHVLHGIWTLVQKNDVILSFRKDFCALRLRLSVRVSRNTFEYVLHSNVEPRVKVNQQVDGYVDQ